MSSNRKLPAQVTLRWLRGQGACGRDRRRFAETFPNGVGKITATTVRVALKARLDLDWLLQKLGTRGIADYYCCLQCAFIAVSDRSRARFAKANEQIASTLRRLQQQPHQDGRK